MPSSEKVISPGVFTNEIDQTFLPAAIGDIGAAIVGPTAKGPYMIPTVVNSYSQFTQIFGSSFKSGSNNYTYLTSLTAKEYLKNQGTLTVVRLGEGSFTQGFANVLTGSLTQPSASYGTGPSSFELAEGNGENLMNATGSIGTGGTDGANTGSADFLASVNSDARVSFRINTQGYGRMFHNASSESLIGSNGLLKSGSSDNIRYEVTSTNTKKGTFSLLVRQGNDTHKRKQILETWNNVSLDPTANNYVEKIIGNQKPVLSGTTTEPYIAYSGSYPNKSKYIYITDVNQTVDYLDENGNVRLDTLSSSLPGVGSGSINGSFSGSSDGFTGFDSFGNLFIGGETGSNESINFYENISTQTQGFYPETASSGSDAYKKALNLLSNQDEYDINLLLLPGIISATHTTITAKAIDTVEERGDCFLILDPVVYGSAVTTAASQADGKDSNYASMYWPWVQIPDADLGRNVWVPPSVAMAGIYGFNDKVAHPWFAPAGLNRGGIDIAVQAERKLTQSNRDDLYNSNMNPIATFPGQGVVVWGQKTLQKKASALDRVNVRRLLIKLKKFIASTSRFLVFEQNNSKTRGRFLNIVNPYMEQVQSNSGLSAFRVVMDESNNTADTIDRNILYGQIFIQPTRTAEFIVLDFTIQPSGATFPE